MKASELRIGNYVWEDYGGDYVVTSIHNKSFETIGLTKPSFKTEGVYLVDEIKPILLTEEWLFKFGFENDFNDTWESGQEFLQIQKTDKGYVKLADGFYYDSQPLKHVHQLQNLYFALTGKELTIKE